ncbi:cytochrome d ubiquinol oxidase subunit II [Methyloterricola oryzae]|uniref:cytochrome d ubiquinol oxidase subunit II n=1 Tax=Methyloterricola oryzae TaxID=1495050 RepID=UPI0009E60695|nr:cytochrome d ubiquinol oxidase subunit II [Methyloterricola oryzae]
MIDYETIRVIWWLFIGVVAIGFALTNGFDFGIGALIPFLGRTDTERRVIINTVGATWEGNQVWLVLLGGAIFAVWPLVYATLFSGLYAAMLLVLFALFFRPAGFDYRSKLENPTWRNAWDWGLCIGGAVPSILLGVLVGNLILGLPYHLDADLRSFYTGTFLGLLHPYALLCGVIGLLMNLFHGSIFLMWRTEGTLRERARGAVAVLGPALLVAMVLATLWTLSLDRPEIAQMAATDAPSNPLNKTVVGQGAGWLAHFTGHAWMLPAPVVAFAGFIGAYVLGRAGSAGLSFLLSSLGIAGLLLTIGFGLFPFLLISSTDPKSSLTMWDATASHFNLLLSFWITVVFLPIVLAYTRWVYKVIWGSVTEAKVLQDSHTLY